MCLKNTEDKLRKCSVSVLGSAENTQVFCHLGGQQASHHPPPCFRQASLRPSPATTRTAHPQTPPRVCIQSLKAKALTMPVIWSTRSLPLSGSGDQLRCPCLRPVAGSCIYISVSMIYGESRSNNGTYSNCPSCPFTHKLVHISSFIKSVNHQRRLRVGVLRYSQKKRV